jgi:hypothetical protein
MGSGLRRPRQAPVVIRRARHDAKDVSNKADFVGLLPRLLSIGLSP